MLKREKVRVILHPSSANLSHRWFINKFIKLAKKIYKHNFWPVFVVSKSEKEQFKFLEQYNFLELQAFDNLSDLASFIFEAARGA